MKDCHQQNIFNSELSNYSAGRSHSQVFTHNYSGRKNYSASHNYYETHRPRDNIIHTPRTSGNIQSTHRHSDNNQCTPKTSDNGPQTPGRVENVLLTPRRDDSRPQTPRHVASGTLLNKSSSPQQAVETLNDTRYTEAAGYTCPPRDKADHRYEAVLRDVAYPRVEARLLADLEMVQ